jgi:hypothetical protein
MPNTQFTTNKNLILTILRPINFDLNQDNHIFQGFIKYDTMCNYRRTRLYDNILPHFLMIIALKFRRSM